jgi:hypothetical protein
VLLMPDLAMYAGSDSDDRRAVGHVFLSYAAEDAAVARLLADDLTRLGMRVWWDRLITGGAQWGPEIERALVDARAVVVLWSPASVASHFVRAEARTAADRRTLIPAIIEPCELPMPFGEFQALDLTAWRAAGDVAALDGLRQSIERIATATADSSLLDASRPIKAPSLVGRSGIGEYAADLVHMITGPKAFLRQRLAQDRVGAAARFFGISLAIEATLSLPLALKISPSLRWELLGTAIYQPARMLLMGIAVHLSWRAVGGRAPAMKTLTAFAYVYGALILLYACTQNLAIGLLRSLRPDVAERVFASPAEGSLAVMQEVIIEQGIAPSAAFLLFTICPLVIVPFVCWGAFRHEHNVSRLLSPVAAAIALVLATLAYALTIVLSFISAGPG